MFDSLMKNLNRLSGGNSNYGDGCKDHFGECMFCGGTNVAYKRQKGSNGVILVRIRCNKCGHETTDLE